jgi:hypothetical protein
MPQSLIYPEERSCSRTLVTHDQATWRHVRRGGILHSHTEQVDVAVKLYALIREVLGSNPDRGTGYPVRGFYGSFTLLQADAGIVPRSSHGHPPKGRNI